MVNVWDYDVNELKKTESGRRLILERQINYGIYLHDRKKIKLSELKKYWGKLNIDSKRRRLFQFLIWEK